MAKIKKTGSVRAKRIFMDTIVQIFLVVMAIVRVIPCV